MIIRNKGITPYPKFLLRFLFLLQNGLWAAFFSQKEKHAFKKSLQSMPPPDNPIIIIGHWRTGSTLLHQLLNLDSELIAPTVFQVSLPKGFLVSRKYYQPIMNKVLGNKRPMDNVKLGFDEPQEDEYALLKTTRSSPLEDLIFPKNTNYFLSDYSHFNPPHHKTAEWAEALCGFCKKITIRGEKTIILKNPFHSLRIPLLKKIFPHARFIHITRNPIDVIPSTQHMWNIVGKQNALKKGFVTPSIKEITLFLNKFLHKIQTDLYELPSDQYYEICFEDLEKNPIAWIKKIYGHFGIEYSSNTEKKMQQFLEGLKSYRKNEYHLCSKQRETIVNQMRDQMMHYNYI